MKHIEKMRKLCFALPDVTESVHFDSIAFKARGKLFAAYREHERACEIVIGLQPKHAAELLEADARFTRYPRAKNAVAMRIAKAADWADAKDLLAESYSIAVPARKRSAR